MKTRPKQRKKCHGDRKRRRLIKKCHRQRMTKEEMEICLHEYERTKQTITNQTRNNYQNELVEIRTSEDMEITMPLKVTIDERIITQSRKRKRMTPSSSQQSFSSQMIKKKRSSQIPILPIKTNYKLPMYLKVHPNLLFRSLHVHLNYTIKKKKDRQFLHHRLQLFDKQCRLDHQKELWQSYFILGSEQQLWPVSFHSLFIINNIKKIILS